MTTMFLLAAIGANVGAAVCNLLSVARRERLIRFLRSHIDATTGAVAFASILARDDSPVPDGIRALARRAYPSWRTFEAIPPRRETPPPPPSTWHETVH